MEMAMSVKRLPRLSAKRIPWWEKLQPGSRIVAHDFDRRGVTPGQVVRVTGGGGHERRVYGGTTPLKKAAPKTEQ